MDVELDNRLSEESRAYIVQSFQIARPADILNADLRLVRMLKDHAAIQLKEIVSFEDMDIEDFKVVNPEDGHEIIVRKFIPKKSDKSSITVFFHGGGFCLGSIETHNHTVGFLARKTNSIWLSVEYRRCPDEGRYPAPYLDCKSVVEWTIKNKKDLGCEFSKLGICGDSSGGQMASIIAHELKHHLDYQILIYPCVHFSDDYKSVKEFTKECFYLVPEVIEFFTKNLTEEPEKYVNHLSPILYEDFSKLPKCLIIAAELDPLVDHSIFYHEKLVQNDIESYLGILKGTIHGYFSQPLIFKNAFQETEQLIFDFFQKI
ncbi:esterase [Brachionus plicatilis]|uniref:Esterase n=1 Tax=Brachionus plicatilis TaxID=10195 RepID=A0A3M7QFU2_BRAPC|nr:esterase [Brachionus plicatilis]